MLGLRFRAICAPKRKNSSAFKSRLFKQTTRLKQFAAFDLCQLGLHRGAQSRGTNSTSSPAACHFNALERFEYRMWIGGTPWDRKRSSTKVGPRIALALPNRQMTS